eukprot:RCo053015
MGADYLLEFGKGDLRALNAALVVPPLDLEQPLQAPGVAPAVHHQPVGHARLLAPSDDLHGMAAKLVPIDMVVHPAGVQQEVRVHDERPGDGAAREDRLLDFLGRVLAVQHLRERSGPVNILGPGRGVAGVRAPRLIGALRGFRRIGAVGVGFVVARGNLVGVARARGAVVSARHQAVGEEVQPREPGVPALAPKGEAEVPQVAARCRLLRGEDLGDVLRDAQAVIEGFRGGEGPAGPAVRLVSDVANDTRAARPLLARVERCRDVIVLHHGNLPGRLVAVQPGVNHCRGGVGLVVEGQGPEPAQVAGLRQGHALEAGLGLGHPRGAQLGVDATDRGVVVHGDMSAVITWGVVSEDPPVCQPKKGDQKQQCAHRGGEAKHFAEFVDRKNDYT